MENIKYGRRREGRWTPIRAKAQDTRANPNSWETHLVRKRCDIGLLRPLSTRFTLLIVISPGRFTKQPCLASSVILLESACLGTGRRFWNVWNVSSEYHLPSSCVCL